ncbi:mechanosensitive ion channel family protein [Alkalitalea saponilacus]|uniref:Small conductance mechanosensitive channel n=1 Tax=Alkalitalea saponilacus TaxID=889453 RepID=A0A1T5A1N4_9BACT|nr:mechanosensitive ion channel family protein [Alkalitalea saponilacus]ASB48906.1 mechanosensitive ion channel protein MscS [Alkalitalea saponilacus]SKB28912.1 small conductance mechanosensitive channel [Alkalitalea saponilacus]
MTEYFSTEFWENMIRSLSNWVISELPGIVIILLAFAIFLKILRFSKAQFRKILYKRAEEDEHVDTVEAHKRITTLTSIIHAFLKIVLYMVVIMMLLSSFSVNIGPILASAGILGLAIGFGAQELVRDYIAGFFMLLDNQIRRGDVAIINGTGGLVERLELRTITLRDVSGVVHIFQNGKINSISNMTKEWSAMTFDIGVAYKEDVDNVMRVMKEVGDELYNDDAFKIHIIEPMEVSGLNEFGDSALVIRARIKTKPGQQWGIGREYRKRLKKAFDLNNIEIPFPHTTIYWGEEIKPLNLNVQQQN